MKLLITLILLPLGLLINKAYAPVKTTEVFSYEITVTASGMNSALFDLTITGFTLADNGTRVPFRIDKENIKTPFKLSLKNGKYTAVIDSKSKDAVVISKVQGIKDGNKVGSASGDAKKTVLDFGFGGNYAATGK